MVNQLLTEMDGFHREEMVFVVGTTNFVEILDPAATACRAALSSTCTSPSRTRTTAARDSAASTIAKCGLKMSPEALEYAVRRSGDPVPGAASGTRYSGDHLNALCRAVARIRLRDRRKDVTTQGDIDTALNPTRPEDIEQAISEWIERPRMTEAEERVVATHEAGHAICSLHCKHSPPIERISIMGDTAGALGFVQEYCRDPAHRYVITRGRLLDDLVVLMGGREAEQLLLDDLSIGSAEDLRQATAIARALVEEFGMGGEDVGVVRFLGNGEERNDRHSGLSPMQLEALDRCVRKILEDARARAARLLIENRSLVEALRDLLVKKKVVDAKTLGEMAALPEKSGRGKGT